MSEMRRIPDHELQPAAPPPESFTHQRPLYVIARMMPIPNPKEPTIITLPGGHLLTGMHTIPRAIEHTANEIAREQQIITSADAHLYLPKEAAHNTHGFSVKQVIRTPLPNMANFVDHPTPADHDLPLEMHAYSNLVELLDGQPGREIEVAYLRAFGEYALRRLG